MTDNIVHTKWGSARVNKKGYYQISSRKEGNRGKYLHRLIYEDFWGVNLPKQIHIHHKNGDKKKFEERINTEFIYVYNYKNIESHESISLKCPSCGAPIQDLTVKTCPYCKSGIIDLATKTWVLNDISKV